MAGPNWLLLTKILAVVFTAANGLRFGFNQVDFSGNEENGMVSVVVVKEDENVGPFTMFISPLTFDNFELLNLMLPSELQSQTPPDPAETSDFSIATLSVTFPPNTTNQEMTVNIPLTDDMIHEPLNEGFYLLAHVTNDMNNPVDTQNAVPIRNGVALVNIVDNEVLTFTFENGLFNVPEEDAVISDLVFVTKDIESELTLSVLISSASTSSNPASQGPDFDFESGSMLTFGPEDMRLSLTFSIFEDDIVETLEEFSLQLSIPDNIPREYSVGSITSAVISITDDDVAIIGFEQTQYMVNETDGYVEVSVVLVAPSNLTLLSDAVFFLFGLQTINGTAEGGGVDYVDFSTDSGFIDSLGIRFSVNITIINDDIMEDIEHFNVTDMDVGALPSDGNFIFSPSETTIFIIDDDTSTITTTESLVTTTEGPMTTTEGPMTTTEGPMTTTEGPMTTTEGRMTTTEGTTTTMEGPMTTTEGLMTTTEGTTTTMEDTTEVTTTEIPTIVTATRMPPPTTIGGDPHFSILLLTGQLLCFSVQGEHGFTFNLISNDLLQMNGHFVADKHREEVTWIGSMGIVVKSSRYKQFNDTKLRFVAPNNKIFIGESVSLSAKEIGKIKLAGGKLSISEKEDSKGPVEVYVSLQDVGVDFSVRFMKRNHLDIIWHKVLTQPKNSHGLIGQFLREGVDIDETRRLLQLPGMDSVPVMRKPVWHFMERETPGEDLCWVAMNPGYQGKKLIEGHYLDYVVDDVLSSHFVFKKSTKI